MLKTKGFLATTIYGLWSLAKVIDDAAHTQYIRCFLIWGVFSFQSVSEEGTDHHRVEIFSDDEDDFSSPEEGSDSEPMLDDQVSHSRRLMSGRKARGLGSGKATGSSASAAARQRNLKQKFVSLLKKFKVTDPEELDQEQATLDEKISGIN